MRITTIFLPLHVNNCRLIYRVILTLSLLIISSAIFAQPVIVLNSAGAEPLSTKSQNGFLDEVARNIFNKIGYTLVIKKLPAERALRSANSGLIDGEIIRVGGIEKIYPNLIRVPEKIINLSFFVFSRKPINLQQGWGALAGKNVAFITGWKILENNTPNTALITKVRDSQQLFYLLEKDRTDYVIYEQWGGNYIVNQTKLKKVSMHRPALATEDLYIYLHKKHRAIVPRLSQALADIKKDGSYNRLVNKHLLPIQTSN